MKRTDELSKEDILLIFERNFGYKRIPTPLGDAIIMPSREAFIFCNVTGSGYLDNYIYPFTPKGLMKLFYNAFDYKFVTGVFDNTTLKNTPFLLSKAKPFLFNTNTKYIVPIEFQSDMLLQDFLESNFASLKDPTQYIIMRIEKSKKGNGLESFMEYLASEFFKKKGFVVENQIPLAYAVGSPDFGGYSIENIINTTRKYLPYGFHIIELAMLRLNIMPKTYISMMADDNECIVGEAKTSTKIMDTQIKKYLDTGLFDWGIELHPNKKLPTANDRGILTLSDDYLIKFIPPKENYISNNTKYSKLEYIKWLENYMKFYLISNLTNDEFNDLFQLKTGCPIDSQESLIRFVNMLSPKDILLYIENITKNGIIK